MRRRVVRAGIVARGRAADNTRRVDALAPDQGRRAQARRQRVGLVVRIPGEHGVPLVEPVVDADVGRIVVLRAVVRIREVVRQPGAVRRRIELHVLDRDRVEAGRRDHVARKGCPAVLRVVNLRGQLREIAGPHLGRGHGHHARHTLLDPVPLVVDEEERPIPAQRSTQAAAKLVLPILRLALRKELAGVEFFVAGELESGSVKLVAARLRDDVDHAAQRAAGLGRVHVGLDAHFRNRVNRRLDRDRPDRAFVVVHAIDELIVQHVVDAVDRHRRGLPALVGSRAVGQGAERAFVGTGHELHHANDVSPRNGRILHGLLIDQRADRRRVGLQQRGLAADGKVLLHRPELQLRVNARAIAGCELDARRDRLEALQLDPYRISADRQEGEHVVTGIAGDGGTHVLGRDVLRGHRDRGQHGPTGVRDAADDVRRALRECKSADDERDGESAAQCSEINHTASFKSGERIGVLISVQATAAFVAFGSMLEQLLIKAIEICGRQCRRREDLCRVEVERSPKDWTCGVRGLSC